MKRCLIISGGDFCDFSAEAEGSYIIACDRGCQYAARLGLVPDLIIGDFDSYSGSLPAGVPVEKLPCEKDDTDTHHAVRRSLEMGFGELFITCALGGRLDHTLANIQSCVYAAERGAAVTLADGRCALHFLRNGELTLPRQPGRSLSLFAAFQSCSGVSAEGVKYPLCRAELKCSFPLGVSNEWAAEEARISVEQGVLIIVTAEK